MNLPPDPSYPPQLQQLLRREDMWVGRGQAATSRPVVDTGFVNLNEALLNKGWPLASLIEICQQGFQAEWHLMLPALLKGGDDLIVLLNPPAQPFCQGLIQQGLDLERVVVVAAPQKSHFLACFIELTRAGVSALLAWQPKETLSYTELRKCLLASNEGKGLYLLFRPAQAQQQSSPATLRLFNRIVAKGLEVTLFKQKGLLQTHQARPILLPLPNAWQALRPYHRLDYRAAPAQPLIPAATIIPLGGKS